MKRKFEEVYPFSTKFCIDKDDMFVSSPSIRIPNMSEVSFLLSFNPNGGTRKDRAIIGFHLTSFVDSDITVNAVITCKSAEYEKKWNYTFKKMDVDAYTYKAAMCSSAELNDPDFAYFVNNQMIIDLEGSLKIESIAEDETKIKKIETLGNCLWKSEGDKDVLFLVGERELKAHKVALKLRSPKFAKLLAETIGPVKFYIEQHTFETVKEAIMFCYDIQNSDPLSADSASKLLILAYEFQIADLKKQMEEFCMEHVSSLNVISFANAAVAAKSESLKRKCFQVLMACMKDGTPVTDIEKINGEMKETLFFKSFSAQCEGPNRA